VEARIFSRQSAHRWRWGCQPYAPAAVYPQGRFLVLISVRGWVDPRVMVRLEGWGQLKNPVASSGIEPATFRFVALVPQPTTLPHAPKFLFVSSFWKMMSDIECGRPVLFVGCGGMAEVWWVQKTFEGRYYLRICLYGLRKTTKNFAQNNRCTSWDSNRAPPEHEWRPLSLC
jgi:hypothetical protein